MLCDVGPHHLDLFFGLAVLCVLWCNSHDEKLLMAGVWRCCLSPAESALGSFCVAGEYIMLASVYDRLGGQRFTWKRIRDGEDLKIEWNCGYQIFGCFLVRVCMRVDSYCHWCCFLFPA